MTARQKTILVFAAACALGSFALLRIPGEFVLDDDNCRPIGLLNSVRARIRGSAFWKDQLRQLEREIEWQHTLPERLAAAQRELAPVLAESQRMLDSMSEEYPELRPSKSQRLADSLRARADSIEHKERERLIEEYRIRRIDALQGCRARLVEKLAQLS